MPLEPDFTLSVGDTGPPITAQLQDAAGAGVDVSGTTVTFRMAPIAGGEPVVDGAADLVTPATGEVAYEWVAGDTDVPGYYRARWRVAYVSGVVESFPNDRPLIVLVTGAA